MEDVFNRLKAVLKPDKPGLVVTMDEDERYEVSLNKGGETQFFGKVEKRKRGISFHLMPLYCHPRLQQEVSHDLEKRMKGKTCFQFTSLTAEQVKELQKLVELGYTFES